MLSRAQFQQAAADSGFQVESYEKVHVLVRLLAKHELEFLEKLNGAGEIEPEVLTGDPAMQAIIRDLPGLKWKALNVKKRLGGSDEEAPA